VSLERAVPGPVLHVDDDGPGVPDDERERIFEPFVRVDGVEAPGSGLGLALVAQQARHHGADVEVGESPLGGARFTVRFAAPRQA
jgi:signal transduction histidine kinase